MNDTFVLMGNRLTFSHKGNTVLLERQANALVFDNIKQILEKEKDVKKAFDLYKNSCLETGKLVVKENSITIKDSKIKLGQVYADAFMYAKHYADNSIEILEKFFENVAKNPDKVSRQGLSEFLAYAKMPITDRGTFLAYRYVRNDYYDAHTGTMDNMIGNSVQMGRNLCDSNPNADCSRGLHACHHEYLNETWANRKNILVMEINPRDVVAVPARYDARKLRCCRFRPLCSLDYFKKMLLIKEQAALGAVPVFLTEQTREWNPAEDVPEQYLHRYKPVDAWEWAAQ